MKKYTGNPPKIGEHILSFDGYDLWVTGAKGNWLEIKLVSQKPRLKSNWCLMHNGERFSQNHCYKKMQEYEQPLEKELNRRVIEEYDYLYCEGKKIQKLK